MVVDNLKTIFLFLICICILVGTVSGAFNQTPDNSWVQKTNLPVAVFNGGPTYDTWARVGHSAVTLSDGSIVVMGGYMGEEGDGLSLNDVWRTTDLGETWVLQNASAGWSDRSEMECVVLSDDTIILISGKRGSYGPVCYYCFPDVWKSTDMGVTWTNQSTNLAWGNRYNFGAVALPNDKIVIFGGQTSEGMFGDVWISSDQGVSWTEQSAYAKWGDIGRGVTCGWAYIGRYAFESVVTEDGTILLLGGMDCNHVYNQIWKSSDEGITWTLQNANPDWNARSDFGSVILPDESIVIFAGLAMYGDGGDDWDYWGSGNDVWRSYDYGVTWDYVGWANISVYPTSYSVNGGRYMFAMTNSGNDIMVIGGSAIRWDSSGVYQNDVWVSHIIPPVPPLSVNTTDNCVTFYGVHTGAPATVWFEYTLATTNGRSFKTKNQTNVVGNFTQTICGMPLMPGLTYTVVTGADINNSYVYGENVTFTVANIEPHTTTTYEPQVNTFTGDGLDPVKLFSYDVWQAYVGLMGGFFFGLLICFIFMNIAIKQRSVAISVVLLLVIGTTLWQILPPEFIQISQMLLIAGIAGLLYWLFMKKR
jgi:hypothetical protein